MNLAALISGGKDSLFAIYKASKEHKIVCLISLKSKNQDSYMFHTPNIELVELQAEAMELPLIIQETAGEKEKELLDLKKALERAKKEFNIKGVVTGALFSNYQKERIEKIGSELKLKIISPLWHMEQEKEVRKLLKEGFKIIFSSVAALGFDKSWLGKIITEKEVDELVKLNKKYGINEAGEGGEYESLVLNCPLFKKEIKIIDSEIKEESKNVARLIVKKAELVDS